MPDTHDPASGGEHACPHAKMQASLADPAVQEEPYAHYRELLAGPPVLFDEKLGFWIISRYDLVMQVIRNTEVFSSVGSQSLDVLSQVPKRVQEIEAKGWEWRDTLVTNDPPAHTRFRKLVNTAFSPRRVAEMRDYIDRIVNDLIDGWIDEGEIDAGGIDYVKRFAEPLPLRVIADALGVPAEDAPKFKIWSDASVAPLGMMITEDEWVDSAEKMLEFQHYFHDWIEYRRDNRGEDMISDLVHARVDDERPLDVPELLNVIRQLLVAGNETTTNALAAGTRRLAEQPEIFAELKADPAAIKTFCEEVLRLDSPTQGLFRIVQTDTELEGVRIPAGARVMLRFAAANRDGAKFAEPDCLALERKNAGAHVAFGAGIHHCIGAPLARGEMMSAFEAMAARLENIRLAEGKNDFRHYPNLCLRGLRHLHITFDKAG